jgi:hypothetical protein
MKPAVFAVIALACASMNAFPDPPQGVGTSGTITGTVSDPSGAVVNGATVEIQNKVAGYDKTTTTDATGTFKFVGIPMNSHHTTVTAAGFQPHVEDVDVRTTVAVNLAVSMGVAASATSLSVPPTLTW